MHKTFVSLPIMFLRWFDNENGAWNVNRRIAFILEASLREKSLMMIESRPPSFSAWSIQGN